MTVKSKFESPKMVCRMNKRSDGLAKSQRHLLMSLANRANQGFDQMPIVNDTNGPISTFWSQKLNQNNLFAHSSQKSMFKQATSTLNRGKSATAAKRQPFKLRGTANLIGPRYADYECQRTTMASY